MVKGGMGCILVVRNIKFMGSMPTVTDWACAIVDGENIKADTWYRLKDGQFIEVEN